MVNHTALPFDDATSTGDVAESVRSLIPGIEPGGSRVGQPLKPALLIHNARILVTNWDPTNARDYHGITVTLKLSQNQSLNPGLHLLVAVMGENVEEADTTGRFSSPLVINDLFDGRGSVWAPAFVGARVDVSGAFDAFSGSIRLTWEQIDIPYIDWFVGWDYLDHITDGEIGW